MRRDEKRRGEVRRGEVRVSGGEGNSNLMPLMPEWHFVSVSQIHFNPQ